MSNDNDFRSKKMLNVLSDFLNIRSKYQLSDFNFGNKADNIFELLNIFLRFDKRFKGINDFSFAIDFDDTNLNRNIFLRI
jgi:hypothetical protein